MPMSGPVVIRKRSRARFEQRFSTRTLTWMVLGWLMLFWAGVLVLWMGLP